MSKAAQQANVRTTGEARRLGFLPQVGLVAALAALVGASCCALPLVLAWVGLAGAWIANLEIFVVYRPYITAVAAIVIGVGWMIALQRGASRRTLAILGVASLIVAAALALSHYEGEVTRYLVSLRRK